MAIRTALSPKIRVTVNGKVVGAIQSIGPSSTRPLKRIKEVGTDGFIEIVPTSPTEINLDVTRIAFDRKRLPEGFGQTFHDIQAQVKPFDVVVVEATGTVTGDESAPIRTYTYKDCWLQSYGATYTQDDYVISETATIWAKRLEMTSGGLERELPAGNAGWFDTHSRESVNAPAAE